MNKRALILFLAAMASLSAIKPRYGGSVVIRLNEPTSFAINISNYSNLIFYSLIYENFFSLSAEGAIQTHLFEDYGYDSKTRTLTLKLKENLNLSNGASITPTIIAGSLKTFLDLNTYSSGKVNKVLKGIRTQENLVIVELLQDIPDIVNLLAAPELVVTGNTTQAFSGPFFPSEWEKGRRLVLKANPFYPGGRPYLDSIQVVFENTGKLDIFLSSPAQAFKEYIECPAGVFQNIYLLFPQGDIGQNTKVALYTLMQNFNESIGRRFSRLSSLTSDDESPISVRISPISDTKVATLLHSSGITLYILSSLSQIEAELNQFLANFKAKITTVFIDDTQLKNLLSTSQVKFVVVDKIFQKKFPPEEKLMQILKESAFLRLSDKYLKMLDELEEVKMMNQPELLQEQIAHITEMVISEGFILPLFQKKYSLYVHTQLQGLTMDIFARPMLQKAKHD